MQIFACPDCGATVYFDNLTCACGRDLFFDPSIQAFLTIAPPCANREAIQCNWIAPEPGSLCASCASTAIVPDGFQDENIWLSALTEASKRWVFANLMRWGWFGEGDNGAQPEFHMLAEETRSGLTEVMMGHAAGVVTINVAEADPATLVARREMLDERFRTMIGHMRHELAHFLFERLAVAPAFVAAFRDRFGDERADYGEALQVHYENGPPPDWAERHVTAYASAHPHEDWAESVAHLLHLTDAVDSASAAGLAPENDAYASADSEALITRGITLGMALNHVNRSSGLFDLYPFVLSDVAREKLAFAHHWLHVGPSGQSQSHS